MPLPETLRPYFWNCRFEELDQTTHQNFVIEQLLEYGNLQALQWMMRMYQTNDIIPVLRQTRILSPESRSFWSAYFHLDLPADDTAPGNITWRHRNQIA